MQIQTTNCINGLSNHPEYLENIARARSMVAQTFILMHLH